MQDKSSYPKIVHIITGLGDGGAEGVLCRLCCADPRSHVVISLTGLGKYGPDLQQACVETYCLTLDHDPFKIRSLWKLLLLLRRLKPSVVQTWMYHSDFLGGLFSYLLGIKNIYWGIRNSTLDPKRSKIQTILIMKICALLSYFVPKKIVSCSMAAAKCHIESGYCPSKMLYIPNGVDTSIFRNDFLLGKKVRKDLHVSESQFVFGMVARYDPQKDHETLLRAFSSSSLCRSRSIIVLAGQGMDDTNFQLMSLLRNLSLQEHVLLIGPQRNIPALMNAFDIHVLSSSYGEAFPNVIAESMATGTPCIASDVGDSCHIISSSGWIFKPFDFLDLAQCMERSIHATPQEYSKLSEQARSRIASCFSLQKMIQSYNQLYLHSK